MPSTDGSSCVKHYYMSWEEYQILANDFVVWIAGTGPNIFAWMIDDSIDAFYDDMNQSWEDLFLTVRPGQKRTIFIHFRGATAQLYEFTEVCARTPNMTVYQVP